MNRVMMRLEYSIVSESFAACFASVSARCSVLQRITRRGPETNDTISTVGAQPPKIQ